METDVWKSIGLKRGAVTAMVVVQLDIVLEKLVVVVVVVVNVVFFVEQFVKKPGW
jgi:hypothetical protein